MMTKEDIMRRLLETKSTLSPEVKKEFENFLFDLPNNRLYSKNREYVLEWTPSLESMRIRNLIYAPPTGVVRCYMIVNGRIVRD